MRKIKSNKFVDRLPYIRQLTAAAADVPGASKTVYLNEGMIV